MFSVFILVFKNENGETKMTKLNEEDHVIKVIGQMESCEVERVFEVSSKGEVRHYNIVFKGRLRLERVDN